MGQGVSLKEIVEKMNLKNLTPDVDLVEKYGEQHYPIAMNWILDK